MKLDDVEKSLIGNSLNEIQHGLPKTNSVARLLKNKQEIEHLASSWKAKPSADVIISNWKVLRKIILVVITELGDEEFSIRTGVTVAEARTFLNKLDTSTAGR